MFGTLGVPEIAIIFIVALVLFGPRKLPELGRTIGKAMTEFRRASNDLKSTFEREMHTLERENQSLQQATRETAKEIGTIASSYDHPPADSTWNPLGQEPSATQPAAVGASEVPGAESNGTAEATAPAGSAQAIEGTVPRGATPAETTASTAPAEPAAEQTQHS
jgi:sec-independent protein translocase protein TatA